MDRENLAKGCANVLSHKILEKGYSHRGLAKGAYGEGERDMNMRVVELVVVVMAVGGDRDAADSNPAAKPYDVGAPRPRTRTRTNGRPLPLLWLRLRSWSLPPTLLRLRGDCDCSEALPHRRRAPPPLTAATSHHLQSQPLPIAFSFYFKSFSSLKISLIILRPNYISYDYTEIGIYVSVFIP